MSRGIHLAVWSVIFVCLATCFAERKQGKTGKDLLFLIKPVQSTFIVGSDIEFHFSLKNVSNTKVLATRSAGIHDFTYLEVVDRRGKAVAWQGKIVSKEYPPDSFVVLQPGESVAFRSVISSSQSGYAMQKPGTYRVRAEFSISPKEYFAAIADDAEIPDQPVSSNWSRVTVKAK